MALVVPVALTHVPGGEGKYFLESVQEGKRPGEYCRFWGEAA